MSWAPGCAEVGRRPWYPSASPGQRTNGSGPERHASAPATRLRVYTLVPHDMHLRRAAILSFALAGAPGLPGAPGGDVPSDAPFGGALVIPGLRGPVMASAGDFDGDGKLDIVTATLDASVQLLLQDPAQRDRWTIRTVPVRGTVFFVSAVDLNGDGRLDVLTADPTETCSLLLGNGDGTFAEPRQIRDLWGARWLALADWDADG